MINQNGKYKERTTSLVHCVARVFPVWVRFCARGRNSPTCFSGGDCRLGMWRTDGNCSWAMLTSKMMVRLVWAVIAWAKTDFSAAGHWDPDLTNISTERSDAEILGVLSNTGTVISPVMQPIYTTDPLTVEEQADLLAFMKSSVGQPETDKELLVFGISIVGIFGAAVVLGFVYRNRLRSVRRALVNKAAKGVVMSWIRRDFKPASPPVGGVLP